MADIFISYKTEDHDRIEPLARALEAEGWDVWWDRELLAGTISWGDTIATELANAKCVIVAWSKLAAASPWVRDEAQVAYSDAKAIPIVLEPMKLPLGFGQVQAAPFFDWRGGREEQAYQKLLQAIRAKLKQPVPAASRPVPVNERNWRGFIALASGGLAIAAIVGVATFLFFQWFPSKDIRQGDNQSIANSSGISSTALVQKLREQIAANKIVFSAPRLEQQLLGLDAGTKVTPKLQSLVLRLSELASPIRISSIVRTGGVDAHSTGRAVDIGNEEIARTLLPRIATQDQVDLLEIDEIIFDAGVLGEADRQKWNFEQGKPHNYDASTLSNYGNHIHFAVK